MASASHTRIYERQGATVFRTTTGPFGGLSNMAPNFPLEINGVRIPTVEALYQACRFPDRPDIQKTIIDQPSPMTAKMKSKRYREYTRSDWNNVRVNIMRWCLRVKLAQNWSTFGALLGETGDRPIVEESRKDEFWGAKPENEGRLVGINVLGRLLMELRQDLQSSEGEKLKSVERPKIPNFSLMGKPVGMIGAFDREPVAFQPSMFG